MLWLSTTLLILLSLITANTEANQPIYIQVTDAELAAMFGTFLFGSEKQDILAQFSLNTVDIVIPDFTCNHTAFNCQNHCFVPLLCRTYCNPICCLAKPLVEKYCKFMIDNYFGLTTIFNSSSLQIHPDYWTSSTNTEFGVWADDVMFLQANNSTLVDLGVQRIALKTMATYYNEQLFMILGKIGLGRHPKQQNLLQYLYKAGAIPSPVITIVYSKKKYVILGEYNKELCQNNWKTTVPLSDREWILGAFGVSFFDYESYHYFNFLLTENIIVHMPRAVLNHFIEQKFIRPSDDEIDNLYRVNKTAVQQFHYSFDLIPNIHLEISQSSIFTGPFVNPWKIQADAIDPNPDRLEWAVGVMIYHEYCVALDYRSQVVKFVEQRNKA